MKQSDIWGEHLWHVFTPNARNQGTVPWCSLKLYLLCGGFPAVKQKRDSRTQTAHIITFVFALIIHQLLWEGVGKEL